jgi:hypothetical protein
MKKLLLSTVLGLAALAMMPALSQAGTFGLFTGCGWFGCCGCGSSSCTFCVRPYNAFTPVCAGNITCMGCMPFMSPCPNYSGMNYCGPMANACPAAPYGSPALGSEGSWSNCTPSLPNEVSGTSPALPPLPSAQPANPLPPAPIPVGLQPSTTTSMMPNPYYGMIQAGYRPVYPVTYNPYVNYGYYGPMGATPYYWNAK